jgi:hypothetical protein
MTALRPARPAAPRRRIAWVAGAFALAAGTTAFTPSVRALLVPGQTYTFKMTGAESDESFAAAGKVLMSYVGRVQMAGDRARIDFSEVKGPSPAMGKAGYVLMHDGGNTMYMVDTKEKQYMKIDAKALGGMVSSLSSMTGGLMKIEVTNPSMSVRKLGAGESIIGYATEKWEIKQAYTMTMKTFGFGSTPTDESTTTLWMAPQMKATELMNPFLDMAKTMGTMFEGNKEWEAVVMGPSRELPEAAVLKMESRSKSTTDKGKPQYSINSMEVTNWTKGDVNASTFELPSGFKAVEMPNIAAMTDSMKAAGVNPAELEEAMKKAGYKDEDIAEALKQAAKEGAMDEAKSEARRAGQDAVKAGVGRLLRRPPF